MKLNEESKANVLAELKTGRQSEQDGTVVPLALRCINCDALVTAAVCGRKKPCPACGFPYPIGDCSDLAEN